jgi:hypothetical protein
VAIPGYYGLDVNYGEEPYSSRAYVGEEKEKQLNRIKTPDR